MYGVGDCLDEVWLHVSGMRRMYGRAADCKFGDGLVRKLDKVAGRVCVCVCVLSS